MGPEAVAPAVARGAVAVLVDEQAPPLPAAPGDVCAVRVPDVRRAAAVLASRYYGEPGRAMDLIAITGTNGKTSVSYMTESVLRIAEGARVGVIGTAGSRIGDEPIPMPPRCSPPRNRPISSICWGTCATAPPEASSWRPPRWAC